MNNVQIMIADVNDFKAQKEALLSQIAPCYVAKYEKHKIPKDKLQEVVSGYLLREYLGITQDAQLTYNDHEKPMLTSKEKFFNLSHSEDCVVLGIADCDLGIDAEKVRKCHDAMVKKVFQPEHQDEMKGLEGLDRDEKFTEIWTKYEAILKLEGIGLAYGYKEIPVEKYLITTMKQDGYYISCATKEHVTIELISAKREDKSDF